MSVDAADDDLPSPKTETLNCSEIIFLRIRRHHFATRQKHGKLKSCHTQTPEIVSVNERNYTCSFVASFFLFVQLNFLHEKLFVCRNFTTTAARRTRQFVVRKFLIFSNWNFTCTSLVFNLINEHEWRDKFTGFTSAAFKKSDFTTVYKLKQVQYFSRTMHVFKLVGFQFNITDYYVWWVKRLVFFAPMTNVSMLNDKYHGRRVHHMVSFKMFYNILINISKSLTLLSAEQIVSVVEMKTSKIMFDSLIAQFARAASEQGKGIN